VDNKELQMKIKQDILAVAFLIAAIGISSSIAEVTVDPFGFALSIDGGDEAEVNLIFTNDGESDIAFSIDNELLDEEDNRQAGPCRDDLGDVIDEFVPPGGADRHYNIGMAWDADNNWMWNNDFHAGRIYALDPANDYEAAREFAVQARCMGTALLNGHLYMVVDPQRYLTHYDTDGDNLGNIQLPITCYAVTASQEMELLFVTGVGNDGEIQIHVYDVEDNGAIGNEVGTIRNWSNFVQGSSRSICWVDQHPDGQLWLNSVIGGNNEVWELAIDTDDWEATELVQRFCSREGGGAQHWDGIGHDGENLWLAYWMIPQIRIVDDGISEFSMLVINPETGIIPVEDVANVEITIITEGVEADVYNILLEIELTDPEDDRDEPYRILIELSAVISVDEPTFDIFGTVIDAATREAVEGVTVNMDRYFITRFSDEDGIYSFNDLPFGAYEFSFTTPDYLPYIEQVEVGEEGEIERDIELLHAECNLNVERINVNLAQDENTQIDFSASNDGNGPLIYTVDRRLIGGVDVDPWELRRQFPVGENVEDSRIQGVVYANDHFYISGAHNNEPAIYIFDRDGEFQELFIQPGEDRYGMRDLAWDGNLIWGAIGNTIYGITTDGEVQVSFESPFRSTTNITWDSEHQWLWISGTTTNLIALDRNGEEHAELNRQGLRIYGVAYHPDDPDDCSLYLFHKINDVGDQIVHKMNPDNGDTMFVSILEPEDGGSAAGVFITNEFDVYGWVFIAVANAGASDRVDIWHIDWRKDWFVVDPVEGVIEAGEDQQFELILDATGLPPVLFEGELVFQHDGVGRRTFLPVTLNVIEGGINIRTIELEMGWNMVSVNVQPEEVDIRAITRELVEADLLLLMKDGQGRFYSPEFDFCNIPGWNVADGYQMKMDDVAELALIGEPVNAEEPIPLEDGWNMIAYYPRVPVDAIVALSNIEDQLLLAKDGWGRFYNPEWDFSNMGDLQEGRGYQMKVSEDVELVYRLQAEDDEIAKTVLRENSPRRLPVHPSTGNNMSLLVIDNCQLSIEIGVYADGQLVGSGNLQNELCGVAIWGDDPTTPEIDGALAGASLELSLLDENGLHPVQYQTLAGDGLYQVDGFWAVELVDLTGIPDEFGIINAYPNPFNNRTHVKYNLPEAAHIDLTLFDLSGRSVIEIASGHKNAGLYMVTIDGTSLASSVYIVQMKVNSEVSRSKVTLIK